MNSISSVSLADLDLFEGGAPWKVFEDLRKHSPIHWNEEEAPNSGFYSVTRYHDIVKVLRDPDTFTSERFTNLEEVDAEQEEARGDQRRPALGGAGVCGAGGGDHLLKAGGGSALGEGDGVTAVTPANPVYTDHLARA